MHGETLKSQSISLHPTIFTTLNLLNLRINRIKQIKMSEQNFVSAHRIISKSHP